MHLDVATACFGDKRFTFWESPDGTPVSMAGSTSMVGGMIRVDPVYTPAHLRGRGHGGAATVEVCRAAPAAGATDIVLFADPANPTSNALYRRIGYVPVTDFAVYDFSGAEWELGQEWRASLLVRSNSRIVRDNCHGFDLDQVLGLRQSLYANPGRRGRVFRSERVDKDATDEISLGAGLEAGKVEPKDLDIVRGAANRFERDEHMLQCLAKLRFPPHRGHLMVAVPGDLPGNIDNPAGRRDRDL